MRTWKSIPWRRSLAPDGPDGDSKGVVDPMRRKVFPASAAAPLMVGLVLSACGGAQGRASDLLVITPDPSTHANTSPAPPALTDCDPLPQPSDNTVGELRFTGPCPFVQRHSVQCVNKTDDYYAYINRRLPDDVQLSALINVEKYHGPGTYTKNSSIYVQVARNGVLYEWRQDAATLTVSDGGNEVDVAHTMIPPLSGNPARGMETAEGTLVCAP